MPAKLVWLAGLLLGCAISAQTFAPRDAPFYSAASVVNAADNRVGWLAPNTIATIYGSDLAYTTRAIGSNDIQGGMLPTLLIGTGVRVLIGGLPANIYFVSPGQINFLIPSNLIAGPTDIQIVLDGRAGPDIAIQLGATAAALFLSDPQTAIATRPDGSLATDSAPLKPGDYVVLYGNGFGPVVPPLQSGQLPTAAARLKQASDFMVLLDGVAVDAGQIAYAGVTPGFAGLYQINLRLPQSVGPNPMIQVGFAGRLSNTGIHIPVQP